MLHEVLYRIVPPILELLLLPKLVAQEKVTFLKKLLFLDVVPLQDQEEILSHSEFDSTSTSRLPNEKLDVEVA